MIGEIIAQFRGEREIARSVIDRFAQRQPVG